MLQNKSLSIAQEFNHHPYEWWDQSERRKNQLKVVFCEDSNSSEDDVGNKKYIQAKDPNYIQDKEEIEQKRKQFEK